MYLLYFLLLPVSICYPLFYYFTGYADGTPRFSVTPVEIHCYTIVSRSLYALDAIRKCLSALTLTSPIRVTILMHCMLRARTLARAPFAQPVLVVLVGGFSRVGALAVSQSDHGRGAVA